MEHTVVIKLLGWNIGYAALQNKTFLLWKPAQAFRLMDIENGYYLAKFQNPEDCEKVLCQGLWIVYRQYLMMQPWSLKFNPAQSKPNVVMAWVRLPRLSGHMYKRRILWEIGGLIVQVVKLDFHTYNGVQG